MDLKLPSSTGMGSFWLEHLDFLKIASQKGTFIKAVICNDTEIEDFKEAVKLVSNINKNIPFILQPNSFEMGISLFEKIEGFKNIAFDFLTDVRVIPQMHKLVGVK